MSETLSVPNASLRGVDPQADGFACELRDDGVGVACVYMAAELDIASAPDLDCALHDAEGGWWCSIFAS